MIEQQTKEVARRILGLHQRTNRTELLGYIKSLPKSVGIDWESVGDDTFLIVSGFVSVDAPDEPSEFPVPMRVVLDDTDAPMAMLRMWADRVIGDDHEGPADNNCGWGAVDVDAVEQEQADKPITKPRYNWDDICEQSLQMIRQDARRYGWTCTQWAEAFGVSRSAFSRSPAWTQIQYLSEQHTAERIEKL